MAFELKETTECKLLHVNHRYEFHGEDRVLAADLNFEKEGGNELLDLLDPAIRTSLYFNAAATKGQEALPEVLAVLPNLRMPHLNGQKFKWHGNDKFKGYGFTLDYGLGDEQSNVDFSDCAVGRFEFETKEGGSTILRWQLSYAGDALTDDVLAKLIRHEGQTTFIELRAPAVLQLVKGGKAGKQQPAAAGGDDTTGDLLDDDDRDGDTDLDPDSPEGRLAATAGG